uniref:NBS-containing resistance-like protein n=1 Tax=Tanacetum cinerariifolium TaxID=118510 RepID=A0A699HLV8_TANCI|nr:NBS-containing resistance-like protein [Tanacetum cinerariifolium]
MMRSSPLVQKSLYGLKQAPRAWYQRFAEFVSTIGFVDIKCDYSFLSIDMDVMWLIYYCTLTILSSLPLLLHYPTTSKFSAEAEYRGVANVVFESCWLRNLLLKLHCPVSKATIVYCDNVSAIYLSGNAIQHHRAKHIELDIHFVREHVARGQVRVLHVPSRYQLADIFTKGISRVRFDDFRDSLNIRPPTASTAGDY